MSDERLPPEVQQPRLTPWVGRLLVANVVVALLLRTVFTDPSFVDTLQFRPGAALHRPWTFFTAMFVHAGILHTVGNLLLLFAFGPAVERKLGSRAFLLFYLYCGVGSAFFALGLSSFMTLPPMVGATGAILGVGFAFAVAWPDAELDLFPLPLRSVTAKSLVLFLAGLNLILALWLDGGIGHLGYLGGLAAGYIFFRIQGIVSRRTRTEPKAISRRPVMTPMPVRQGSPAVEMRPALSRPDLTEPREEFSPEEVDRVLDKISASGLESLTVEERRFLDEVSKRKRSSQD
jgi:membrane associated rhomboid family serine protease